MTRLSIPVLAIIALTLSIQQPSRAATVLGFTDTEFSNWAPFHLTLDDPYIAGPGPNTSTGSGQRLTTGGNPGPYFQFLYTVSTGDQSMTGAIKSDLTYNPATDDPITSLTLALDIRTSSPGGATGYQMLVKQNNILYYSVPLGSFPLTTGWARRTLAGLSPLNFDSNPFADVGGQPRTGAPNFSPTGAPIQFGVGFLTTVAGGGTGTLRVDIDNLNIVPEPTTTMLALPAVALFAARRMRNRSSKTNSSKASP